MKAARPTSSDSPPLRTPRTRTVPQTIELEAIKDPEAEKPHVSTEKVEGDAPETPPVTDTKVAGKGFDLRMAISGLVGAGVGAGVLALMVYTMPVIDVPKLERMVSASSERVQASENDAQLLKAEIKAVKEEAKRQADVLSALQKQMSIDPAVSDRLKAVEAVLQDLQAKVPSTARAPGKAAALLAGALLLRESLGSGKPLTLDIAVLKAAGVDAAQLAALEPFASSGIATPDALIEQLGTFAVPVAVVTPPKDAGAMTLTERLLESLAKLVTISELESHAVPEFKASDAPWIRWTGVGKEVFAHIESTGKTTFEVPESLVDDSSAHFLSGEKATISRSGNQITVDIDAKHSPMAVLAFKRR